MTKPNFFRILIAVFSVLTIATALSLIGPEIQARAYTKRPPASVLLEFAFHELKLLVPASAVAQVRQMSKCDDILASTLAKAASTKAVNTLAETCAELADRILDGTPTLSVAHLVRTRGLHILGLSQQAEDSFMAAHFTGRHEGWLAARRLRLIFDMGLTKNSEVQQAAQLDAMTVLQDNNYHALLPQLYANFPDFRNWLKTAVKDGNARDLKRFVALTYEKLSLTSGTTE